MNPGLLKKPEVSVLMTVYNGLPHLIEAVDSVLRQTHENFEFIIVDDGSDDSSRDVLQSIKDSRINLVFTEHRGRARALNTGLSHVSCEFILIVDADDVQHPDRMMRQLDFLKLHDEIGVVGSCAQVIDEVGMKLNLRVFPELDEGIRSVMPFQNCMSFPATLIRRSTVEHAGLFRTDLNPAEDYDYLLRCLDVTRVHNLPELLLDYRLSSGSLSTVYAREMQEHTLTASISYLDNHLSMTENSTIRTELEFHRARAHYYHGSMRDARRELVNLLRKQPFSLAFWRYFAGTLIGDTLMSQLRQRGISSKLMWPVRKLSRKYRYTSP